MRLLRNALLLTAAAALLALPASANLVITGAFDGPLSGGLPKGVELYACEDIPDLSIYAIESANNANPPAGPEFTFPAVAVSAGTFIYVSSDSASFATFFGFNSDYQTSAMLINGDDAVVIYTNLVITDRFGEDADGTGSPWDYLDGWAYRVSSTGPDGDNFVLASWTFSGINAFDGETSNGTAATPFPIGTFQGCDVPVAVESTTWGAIKKN